VAAMKTRTINARRVIVSFTEEKNDHRELFFSKKLTCSLSAVIFDKNYHPIYFMSKIMS
jgi:hypothetical protein